METISLSAKTEIKDEKQLERAKSYEEGHELSIVTTNEKSGKQYLTETFEYDKCETFAELVKKYSEEDILNKFNEIRIIRLQDSKRNMLKLAIEDKVVGERAQLAAVQKISGLSASEIAAKLGITL